jgi:hypothetical protein
MIIDHTSNEIRDTQGSFEYAQEYSMAAIVTPTPRENDYNRVLYLAMLMSEGMTTDAQHYADCEIELTDLLTTADFGNAQ